MSSTSCLLDIIPTYLIKEMSDTFYSIILFIVNLSLSSSKFPSIIIPTLKNNSLDPSQLSSYRPIANLSLLLQLFLIAVSLLMLEIKEVVNYGVIIQKVKTSDFQMKQHELQSFSNNYNVLKIMQIYMYVKQTYRYHKRQRTYQFYINAHACEQFVREIQSMSN